MAKPVMGSETDVVGSRVFAFIVDYILSIIVWVVGMVVIGLVVNSLILGYLFGSIAFVSYFILLEGMYGQTPGKMLAGVVVVKEDGSPCTMGASFVRNFLRIIDIIPGFYVVGLVVMLMSDRNQRIGDSVARTVVTRAE